VIRPAVWVNLRIRVWSRRRGVITN
jgi:hypothetical protein